MSTLMSQNQNSIFPNQKSPVIDDLIQESHFSCDLEDLMNKPSLDSKASQQYQPAKCRQSFLSKCSSQGSQESATDLKESLETSILESQSDKEPQFVINECRFEGDFLNMFSPQQHLPITDSQVENQQGSAAQDTRTIRNTAGPRQPYRAQPQFLANKKLLFQYIIAQDEVQEQQEALKEETISIVSIQQVKIPSNFDLPESISYSSNNLCISLSSQNQNQKYGNQTRFISFQNHADLENIKFCQKAAAQNQKFIQQNLEEEEDEEEEYLQSRRVKNLIKERSHLYQGAQINL